MEELRLRVLSKVVLGGLVDVEDDLHVGLPHAKLLFEATEQFVSTAALNGEELGVGQSL